MAKKLSSYNLHMRRALKGKMKGKSKVQRKAIFRAAAKSWKGGKGRTVKTLKRREMRKVWRKYKPKTKTSTGGRKMGSKGFLNASTIMKFARIGALAVPAAGIAMRKDLDHYWKARLISKAYTGFDFATGKFNYKDLATGWLPYVATVAITHGIQKLAGMIRRM